MDALLCCPLACLLHSHHTNPCCGGEEETTDVLFLGDSGIDFWAYPFGQPFGCCHTETWKELRDDTLQGKFRLVNAGVCSAPYCAVAAWTPLALRRYQPQKCVVVQAGANELVYWPLPCVSTALLKSGKNWPKVFHDGLVKHVENYAAASSSSSSSNDDAFRVVYLPESVSPYHAKCLGSQQFYDQLRDSSGVVVTPKLDDYSSFDDGDLHWKYDTTVNTEAEHPRVIYIDLFPAYDQFLEHHGLAEFKKQLGGFEATPLSYRYNNEFLRYVLMESNLLVATTTTGTPRGPETIERS